MNSVENHLEKNASASLLQSLSSSLIHTDPTNPNQNKVLWDAYAADWGPDVPWVKTMASRVNVAPNELEFIGDEWSSLDDLNQVITQYILPYVCERSVVGDIGCGGGRIAAKIANSVRLLHNFDISQGMLDACRSKLKNFANTEFHLLDPQQQRFEDKFSGCFDFLYAFDVFQHCDLHVIFSYFKEIRKMLKQDGRAFVSTANLLSKEGFGRFSKQSKFTVGGFYFITPEIVMKLLVEAGLRIVKRSDGKDYNGGVWEEEISGNSYIDRDFLIIVERNDVCAFRQTPTKPSTFFR